MRYLSFLVLGQSFFIGLSLLSASFVQAEIEQDVPVRVMQALKNTKVAEQGDYAYTKNVIEKGIGKEERFDPRLKPKWSLVSIAGNEPSAEEIQEYEEKRVKLLQNESETSEQNDNDKNNDEDGRSFSFDFDEPESIAEKGTWQLLEDGDEQLVYGFKPKIESEEDRKFLPYVDGKLTIDTKSKTVKTYELSNSRPFKPVLVAKIYKFNLRIDLDEIEPQVFYPNKIKMYINGKAMFKRFLEDNEITFSGFEKIN